MDKRQALAEFQPRRWRMGDVYAPHDMSPMEQFKWSVARRPEKDMIDVLGINPLDHYKVRGRNFLVGCVWLDEYTGVEGRMDWGPVALLHSLDPVQHVKPPC